MTRSLRNQIAEYGFAFLDGYRRNMNSVEISAKVGEPLAPWDGGLVQELVPRASAPPNTYSGIYGFDRFPFHTDLAHWRRPPRYLLLRCIKGFADVPTLLIDGRAIITAINLDVLGRAIVKPRRPRNGAIPLLRLCEQIEDGHRLRWDEVFLVPASANGRVGIEQVSNFLAEAHSLQIALANAGDTLLIDNWRVLHARSPIAAGRESRIVERVYLERLN